jgi:hypothetical protein
MGQAMITRRGGGAGVKLKPVAYASVLQLPASADDGALAVITTTGIGYITVDKDQPATAAAGDLWLKTGFVGRSALLLSPKPLVKSYPFTAMQYIGGAWTFVRVFVYSGGWLELRAWLYDAGDMHTEHGGAFVNDYIEGSYGSITYGASYISIVRTIAGSRTSIRKANSIDLTQFKTLKAVVQISGSFSSPQFSLRVFDGSTQIAIVTASDWTTSEEKTIELNVENLNGVYTVKAYVVNQCTFRVKQVWLE